MMNGKLDLVLKALPIAISLFALFVSAISLGWNIYRDVVLKARLRVRLTASQIIGGALPKPIDTLVLEGTNFGPGSITCTSIVLKRAQLWRRILRKTRHAILINDYQNPMSDQLPKKLEVGEKINLLIRWEKGSFLSEDITHVGIFDTFGRAHWAPREDVIRARAQYQKEFGKGKEEE